MGIALPISNDRPISLAIEGTVTDSVTGGPVAGANISLSLPDDYYPEIKPALTAETDAEGGFSAMKFNKRQQSDSFSAPSSPQNCRCTGRYASPKVPERE